MEEYISRKYNRFYNIIITLILSVIIIFSTLILFTYLEEIISKKKYDVFIFLISFILIICFCIRINYKINEIVFNYNSNNIFIKNIIHKKTYRLNEIQEVNQFILPYLNYIKINNKKHIFVSRTIDPFGDNFTFDSEGDLENIRNTLKKFQKG